MLPEVHNYSNKQQELDVFMEKGQFPLTSDFYSGRF